MGRFGPTAAWGALLAAAAIPAGEASAGPDNRDLSCHVIKRTPNGTFQYEPRPGLSLLYLARADGPFRYPHAGNVEAFTCFRIEPLPEVEDVEVLQAGFELFLGSRRTGLRLIKLVLAGGRVRHEIIGGTLSASERKALERIVAQMQARVGAPR